MSKQPQKEKRKPKYGMFSCQKWMLSKLWLWDKTFAVAAMLIIPAAIVLYALNLYIPSIVLDKLQTSDSFTSVVITILILLLTQLIFTVFRNYFELKQELSRNFISSRMTGELFHERCGKDYYLNYEKSFQEALNRADAATNNYDVSLPTVLGNMAVNIICFFLFGSVVSTLSPLVLLLLIIGSVVSFVMLRWKQNKDYTFNEEHNRITKKTNYTAYSAPLRENAKDLRLYSFTDYINQRFEHLLTDFRKSRSRYQNTFTVTEIVNYLIAGLRDIIAYAFLISKAVSGEIGSAEFVLYFSAISQMSGFITGLFSNVGSLREAALRISDYREFFEIKGKLNRGKGISKPVGRPLSIEFKNVTYKYPQGEKTVIDDISFRIEAGEKIALVGLNGAGKTTLTRLMSGILIPDSGEVLIDGKTVYEYNRDDLYSLFAVVPQEFTILPLSVAENIALCSMDEIDEQRLTYAMETAGILEKIQRLPKGIHTELDRRYDTEAVDLSGGEKQRLLLARAIYRNSPVLILDEPTAALDPIAEDEIYRKYNDISENSTSIFISHRLASTRFCDRIYLLDGSRLAESGTHDELMALGGKYRELFDVQSQYYKEGSENEEQKI